MTLNVLIEMSNAFNKEFPKKQIRLLTDDNHEKLLHYKASKEDGLDDVRRKYKKYLLKKLRERLSTKCKSQRCWGKQYFIMSMPEKERRILMTKTYRPPGPAKSKKWLNTDNIDKVFSQFEEKYKDFKFLGAVPRDFQSVDFYKKSDEDYKNLWKAGKTKIGIIYNTDPTGKPGEHWNALFADFDKGQIYFFDSYGKAPNSDVKKHMDQLEKVIKENCGKIASIHQNKTDLMCHIPTKNYNKHQHQRKGSECGVYSIQFIIKMLEGEKFENISKNIVDDDTIYHNRDIYFTDEEQEPK